MSQAVEMQSTREISPDDRHELGELGRELAEIGTVFDQEGAIRTKRAVDHLQKLRKTRSLPPKKDRGQYLTLLYKLFRGSHGLKRVREQWFREYGQAKRAAVRFLDSAPWASMGCDQQSCTHRIVHFAKQEGGCLILPGRNDLSLLGQPAYVGGNPASPYLCAHLIGRWTAPLDTVWEFGPGITPAGGAPAIVLARTIAMPRMPSPSDPDIVNRVIVPEIEDSDPSKVHLAPPKLVIVPLPLPVDMWSLRQNLRLLREAPGEVWTCGHDDAEIRCHPEFADDLDVYLDGVKIRLQLLHEGLPTKDVHVAVVAPNRLGVPRAVEKLINKNLDWKCVRRQWAFDEEGSKSVGEGAPTGGHRVTVWEVKK